MKDYMVPRWNAVIEHDGERHVLRAGVQVAHKDHPIVTEHPDDWTPVKVAFDKPSGHESKPVETTTSEPGEKRSVAPTRRGARKTTTSKGGDDE